MSDLTASSPSPPAGKCDATYDEFGCRHCDDPEPLQCQREAGHEPPHRYREPAQKYSGAEAIEWANDTWWTDDGGSK